MKDILVLPGDFMEMLESDLERRVLARMIRHADSRGRCFASHAHIAGAIKTGRGAVTRTIAELEKRGIVAKTKRGRGLAYQISERFLVSATAPRPARSDERRQPGLLLPMTGAKSAHVSPQPPPTCADTAHMTCADTALTCAKSAHGKRVQERYKPSSTTELVAAREAAKENFGEESLARSARPGDDAGKERAREAWISLLGQFVQSEMPGEAPRFWARAMEPAADARPYLNKIDAEMRASPWWRERQATRRAGGAR